MSSWPDSARAHWHPRRAAQAGRREQSIPSAAELLSMVASHALQLNGVQRGNRCVDQLPHDQRYVAAVDFFGVFVRCYDETGEHRRSAL